MCMYNFFRRKLACKKRLKCIAISLCDLTQNMQKIVISYIASNTQNITHSMLASSKHASTALLLFHTFFFMLTIFSNIPLIIIHREFILSSASCSASFSDEHVVRLVSVTACNLKSLIKHQEFDNCLPNIFFFINTNSSDSFD